MSKVLPGDAPGQFRRWEVPDVAAGEVRDFHSGNTKYLTAVRLERIQKQAYDEAYARGLKAGLSAGRPQIGGTGENLCQALPMRCRNP
jgi:hypothetical protein